MKRTHKPNSGQTTCHRDGTVTLWDAQTQQWVRGADPTDEQLAALGGPMRARVIRHMDGHITTAGSSGLTELVSFRVQPDTAAALDSMEGGRHSAARRIVTSHMKAKNEHGPSTYSIASQGQR